MSDLIDRQVAIDAFERFIHELGIKDEPYNYGEMALSAQNVPSVENQREWIPVSEKLPEERQSILVWCPERRNIYCACLEKEQWWIFGAFMKVQDEVVAWQPLPLPYKADREVSE